MNKKGFTTIELIMSFSLVTIILAFLIGFTINYRNRVNNEELKSSLMDFKNTITKIIYDDIIMDKYNKIDTCLNDNKCARFIDLDNNSHYLRLINIDNELYMEYDGKKYLVPDNENIIINNFEISNNLGLSHLKISFNHQLLNENYEILINMN